MRLSTWIVGLLKVLDMYLCLPGLDNKISNTLKRDFPIGSTFDLSCEAVWSRLGDALRDSEFPTMQRIPGERVITLRLDGSGSLAKTIPLKKSETLN